MLLYVYVINGRVNYTLCVWVVFMSADSNLYQIFALYALYIEVQQFSSVTHA